ncbi:hypothetical protein ACFVFS_09470 [Kitasatospora sp. NPDC057692]|uniref:hypothetical protein n=1 Tax=Kitasatospora sp. NPDC057692 TaxID=3346215 RepID=UPI0036B84CEA
MRSRRLALTAVAVVALAVTATACGPENSDTAAPASSPAATTAPSAATPSATAAKPTDPAATAATAATATKPAATPSTGSTGSTGSAPAAAPAGTCGAKDLVLTAKAESQAGGYILIAAKARPGVTCTLPPRPPVIAFGSRGIEAAKAEKGVSQPIRLSGADTAYAGVMTKTTKDNQAVEFSDVIVGIGSPDPDPVSLPIGPTNVDRPVVTNWHNLPENAVPVR